MGTIGEQMRQDLARAGYATRTQQMYLSDARKLVKRFKKAPTEIGREELRQYVEELYASGIGASRIKQHLAAMKFLYEKTLGRPSEVSFMAWPRQPRPLARVLAAEDIAALFAALRSPKYRAVAMVMYGAGLRVGEACALEVGDIDAARGVIHVRHGKGDKARDVLLSPKLLVVLRDYWRRERPPLPYLFVGQGTVGPLTPEAMRSALRSARDVQGSRATSPRTCCGTASGDAPARRAGTDIRVISSCPGHSDLSTTAEVHEGVRNALLAKTTSPPRSPARPEDAPSLAHAMLCAAGKLRRARPVPRRPRRHRPRLRRGVSAEVPVTLEQAEVLRAIRACRTSALGGHLDTCDRCSFAQPSYNSCRNRHCPKCQGSAQRAWIEDRAKRILPVGHFHVVFTVPVTFFTRSPRSAARRSSPPSSPPPPRLSSSSASPASASTSVSRWSSTRGRATFAFTRTSTPSSPRAACRSTVRSGSRTRASCSPCASSCGALFRGKIARRGSTPPSRARESSPGSTPSAIQKPSGG